MPGETVRARIDSLVTPATNRIWALINTRLAVTMGDRKAPLPEASDAPDLKRRVNFYGDDHTPGSIIDRQPSAHPGMSIYASLPSAASDRPPPAEKRDHSCYC
jgi:hypothetical protein